MHAGLSIDASQTYKTLQSLESKVLLNDLLGAKDSEEYTQHLRRWVFKISFQRVAFSLISQRYAISVVSSFAYGRRVRDMNHKIVKENEEIDRCEYQHIPF